MEGFESIDQSESSEMIDELVDDNVDAEDYEDYGDQEVDYTDDEEVEDRETEKQYRDMRREELEAELANGQQELAELAVEEMADLSVEDSWGELEEARRGTLKERGIHTQAEAYRDGDADTMHNAVSGLNRQAMAENNRVNLSELFG